jgi:hypothetical protein
MDFNGGLMRFTEKGFRHSFRKSREKPKKQVNNKMEDVPM